MSEPIYTYVKGKGWVTHISLSLDVIHPYLPKPDDTEKFYWYWIDPSTGQYSDWYGLPTDDIVIPAGKYRWDYINNRSSTWRDNDYKALRTPHYILQQMRIRHTDKLRGFCSDSIYRWVRVG